MCPSASGASEYFRVTDAANLAWFFAVFPRRMVVGPTKSRASNRMSPGRANIPMASFSALFLPTTITVSSSSLW